MSKFLDQIGVTWLFAKIKTTFVAKDDSVEVDSIDIDNIPTSASTNLVTSGGVYSEIHPDIADSLPENGMLPNVMYNFGTLTGDTTFVTSNVVNDSIVNHWYWVFDTPSSTTTITWPTAITSWYGGSAPTINTSKHYEVSVMNGIACILEA